VETTVLIGRGGKIIKEPESAWEQELAKAPKFFASRLAFMTPDHHRVRNFVVSELPRNNGKPLPIAALSQQLGMKPDKLDKILGDLEKNLFFLLRDDSGAVLWAFPLTAAKTPHLVRFKSGESSFAA
jgi:hypothetical protein